MKKVLIIHGWPQGFNKNHILNKVLTDRNYSIVAPYLFSQKFLFNLDNVIKYLIDSLENDEPDVIIGMSIGGLIAPHIAERYPKSKLILVATGTKFNPKSQFIKWFVRNKRVGTFFCGILKLIPKSFLYQVYKILNPFYGGANDFVLYEEDMKKNVDGIIQMKSNKLNEIMKFAKRIDNKDVLKRLNNSTLILSGKKDIFMPETEAIELSRQIKEGKLVLTDKSHFNVLSKDSLAIIDNFLWSNQ